MKKTKEWFLCYYDGDKLTKIPTWDMVLIVIFLFPLVWLGAIIWLILRCFQDSFYVTKEEYYQRKIKELKKV